MIGWLRRIRGGRGEAAETAAADPWRPAQLGTEAWRTCYAECCDALLAYDRVAGTVPTGAVRTRLAELRPNLDAALDTARAVTQLGALVNPTGPERDPELVAMLDDDPIGDLSGRLDPPPSVELGRLATGVRDALWQVADEVARLATDLHQGVPDGDVATRLAALVHGLDEASRAGWLPVGHRLDLDGAR